MLKEIILFCYGDSSKTRTWSNVPYLMSKNFEEQGVKVDRINISPNRYIIGILGNIFIKNVLKRKAYTFMRTPLFEYLTNRKIKKAVKKYPNADFGVFLCGDFICPENTIPSLAFLDWTFEMLIHDRFNLTHIHDYHKRYIKQQENVFVNATIVLPMFEETYYNLKEKYPSANVVKISGNVVNNLCKGEPYTPSRKYRSDYVLFVGRAAYLPGLKVLAYAAQSLNLRVEVIGMTHKVWSDAPKNVTFRGYLHKEVASENETYYNLLRGAKVMANPNKIWAAYSSLVEGMYFYNPIIVTKFKQFGDEFGDKIDFGYYVDEDIDSVREALKSIINLTNEAYCRMANAAHEKVKDYTWERYVKAMIKEMEARI